MGTLFLARRSRTDRGPTLALVLEASAHPSIMLLVVLEPLVHPSTKVVDGGRGSCTSEHQGADGARGSRISEPPRCLRLLLQKGSDRDDSFIVGYPNSTLRLGRDRDASFILLGTNHGPKLPMVLEASAHLRRQGADGARGSGTFDLLGADGARGSGTSEPPRYRCCHVLRHDQGPKVLEALVLKGEGPGQLAASFSICRDGSPERRRMDRQSTTRMDHRSTTGNLTGGGGHRRPTRRSRTNRGPTLALVLEASAHPSTKVSVVLEPFVHLSTKVADGGRGSRTSEHQGADGARGSRISEPPRCRRLLLQRGVTGMIPSLLGIRILPLDWGGTGTVHSYYLVPTMDTFFSPTLPYQQGPKLPMVLEAPTHLRHQGAEGAQGSGTSDLLGADGARGSGTSEPPRCRCCHVLRHDQGPKVLEALVPKGEGPGELATSFSICRDGSPERRRMDRRSTTGMDHWSTTGMDRRSTAGNLTGGGGHRTRRSRTNRGPTLALGLEASAHPSTKVADTGRGSYKSEHQGADGARGSRISEPPRCRRLLLQKGSDRDDSFIVGYPNSTFMVETRTLFVFHKSKNFTSDYEIRMPPTVSVNHYSDPEGQHNRIEILCCYPMLINTAGGTIRPIKARSASPVVGTSRPVLTVRRTSRPTPKSNYEHFNYNNLNIRYWSWNFRGCWHQTCPPSGSSLTGFTIVLPITRLIEPGIVIYCHYLPVSGLGNLRACCLPWMW
ncbi:hypothetical protein GOBAR_DD27809 [Gossypium barbadense]|nr:hypothetical protein GOBAR_DD27809 [Gossypium barbadense]